MRRSVQVPFYKRHRTYILLFLIFFLALLLRSLNLGEMPSGFHRDEVISGYAGRFILENGKDFYGNPWPLLYVDKYHDYPPAIPMYFSGLGTYLFGMTVFATRFPIAIIGALVIFPIFFLAKELFKDQRIAFLSAGLVAFLPWHLILSRATAEGIVALTVGVTGLFAMIRFINTKKTIYFGISIVLLLLTYLLYPSYRILIPLLLLPMPILFPMTRKMKSMLFAGFLASILCIGLMGLTSWGQGRFTQTTMFSQDNLKQIQAKSSILAQEEGRGEVTTVKIYHNKIILLSRQFVENYFSYFSPQFLLFPGGLPYRYVVSDSGVLFIIMIPLLLLALYYSRNLNTRLGIFLLYLLLISPIPSPITTQEVPNIHRTLFMIIPISLLAGFGLVTLIDNVKHTRMRLTILLIFTSVFVLEFIYFSHMYYQHANAVKSLERGDMNKEMVLSVIAQKANYEKVVMPMDDAIPIYYLYFTKNFTPEIIGKIHTFLRVDPIDNVRFEATMCYLDKIPPAAVKEKTLFVESGNCPQNYNFKTLEEFSRHDGTVALRIYTSF